MLPNGDRARTISEYLSSSKKRKVEEKDFTTDYVSPGLGGLEAPLCPLAGHQAELPASLALPRPLVALALWAPTLLCVSGQ